MAEAHEQIKADEIPLGDRSFLRSCLLLCPSMSPFSKSSSSIGVGYIKVGQWMNEFGRRHGRTSQRAASDRCSLFSHAMDMFWVSGFRGLSKTK